MKAQVHSGARGKAGGIVTLWNDELEVAQATDKILGKKISNKSIRTIMVKLLIEYILKKQHKLKKNYTWGLFLTEASECIMVVASTAGGMSVEEISKEKPETIIRSKIEVAVGMQEFQAREIAFGLGISNYSLFLELLK